MTERIFNVVNTLGQEGSVETTKGTLNFGSSGDFTVRDAGLADEIQSRYPYLEVVQNENRSNPIHPMRIVTHGVPWGRYDELGRRIKDECPSPAKTSDNA